MSQKAIEGCETRERELLGGTKKRIVFPQRGVIDLPSRIIHVFLNEKEEKLSQRPNLRRPQTWP